MSTEKRFEFLITPEPRDPLISVSQGNFVDITFTVQNISGRRVRVEALVNALQGPAGPDGVGLPAFAWEQRLKLLEAPEWDFGENDPRTFTVRVTVPEYMARGTYRFQLVLIGVEDPDHDYISSDPVSFTVVGKAQDVRPFVLGGLVALAAIIILAVLALILLRPRPQLLVTLQAPSTAVVGVSTPYTITVQNARPISATNVIVEYHLPKGMLAATAFIAEARLRYCDETLELIRCDLGTLGPNQSTAIRLDAFPAPGTTIITNTHTVSTTVAPLRDVIQAEITQETTAVAVDAANYPYSLVLDADASVALLEEPLTVRLLAWRNTVTVTQPVSYTFDYNLPVGYRYQEPLPPNCRQAEGDYFNLQCQSQVRSPGIDLLSPVQVQFTVMPLQVGSQQAHQASLWVPSVATIQAVGAAVDVTPTLATSQVAAASSPVSVVDNSLHFDGQDDYVELGFAQAPGTFTMEMWVQPDSTADAQAMIGAHRQLEDTVRNMFLVGYYNGSLDVNLGGTNYTLDIDKTTRRFHLAVVVEPQGDTSRVTVYVNGEEQPWLEPDEEGACPGCKIFPAVLDGGSTLPWVLGQDWDPSGNSRRTSDFFSGALSEVRLWKTARSREQIRQAMKLRPRSDDLDLLAYWRLEPLAPQSMVIADRVLPANNGKRIQAEWGVSPPRYGTALTFDGWDDVLVADQLNFNKLQANADGLVEVTLAAWIYVDAVPSTEQWVLGSAAPTGGTLGLQSGAELLAAAPLQETQAAQTRSESAQAELAAALQAIQALEMSPAEAALAERIAQLHLVRALQPILQSNFPSSAGVSDALQTADEFTNLTSLNLALGIERFSALAAITETIQVSNLAADIQVNLETLQQLDAERTRLQNAGQNATPLSSVSSVPEDPAAALLRSILQDVQTQIGLHKSNIENGVIFPEDEPALAAGIPVDDIRNTLYLDRLVNPLAEVEQILDGIQNDVITVESLAAARDQAQLQLESWESLRQELAQELAGIVFSDSNARGEQEIRLATAELFLPPIRQAQQVLSLVVEQGLQALISERLGPELADLDVRDRVDIDLAKIALLIQDQRQQLYSNTTALVNAARDARREDLLTGANLPGLANANQIAGTLADADSSLQAYAPLDGFAPYQVSLALAQLSWYERQLVETPADESGLARLQAVEAITQAQTTLDANLDELRAWLQVELNKALAEQTVSTPASARVYDDAAVRILATAGYVTERLAKARENLQKAEQAQVQLADAQQAAEQAQAEAQEAEEIARQVEQEAARRQALEQQEAAAQQRLRTARTPAERAAAQAELEAVRAELEAARAGLYAGLQTGVRSLQQREVLLQELEPRLNNAADRAVEAAMAAARRYNVERWVGPWLDFILGTRTPVKSAYETIRPLALLAAQQVLKASADAQVDVAQKDLRTALEEQNRLVNSSGRNRLRQQIIDDINAYLESLNKDVDTAQQKLNEALAEQQGDQGESKVPLVLAEALAQTVADRVTQNAVSRLPLANLRVLLSSSAELQQSIKDQVRAEMSSALEASRRPVRVRLYYDTYFAILRLNQEINAGIEDQTELNLKIQLRTRLVELNLALLRVLNAQAVLLKPGIGFQQLINQVADESGRAASIEALLKELQSALDNADLALSAFQQFNSASASFILPGLPGGLGAAGSPSTAAGASTSGAPAAATGASTASVGGATASAGGATTAATPADQQAAGAGSQPVAGAAGAGAGSAGAAVSGGAASQPVLLQILNEQPGSAAAPGGANAAPLQVTPTATLSSSPPLNLWLGLAVDQDGHAILAAKSRSASEWTVVKDDRPLLTRQWVHYAVTVVYDAATGAIESAELYRNGSRVKGKDLGEPVELDFDTLRCADGFYIGGLCDAEDNFFYFFGGIDEVRVWNRALSQEDLDNWLKMPGVSFDEFAYWPFDDGPGSAHPVDCDPDATCDNSRGGLFPLTVYGPAWVETGRTFANPTGARR